MQFLFQVPELAVCDPSGGRLMLNDVGAAGGNTPIVYSRVDDLDAVHRGLTDRGVEFAGPLHKITALDENPLPLALARDSEANTSALMAERVLS